MIPTELDKLEGSILAIQTADWHLQSKPPIFRSAEDDWYAAMERPLREIGKLQQKFKCPVIVGGDFLNSWNESHELVNWCFKLFPKIFPEFDDGEDGVYVIPGQHDMLHHQIKDLNKTAFYTIVRGVTPIRLMRKPFELFGGDLVVHPFPWNAEIKPCLKKPRTFVFNLAVVHKYIHTSGTGHAKAKEDSRVKNLRSLFKGYDGVLSGDNHQSFLVENGLFYNPGSLMIRNKDQTKHRPQVGLLTRAHKVHIHYLNTSLDKYMTESTSIAEDVSKLDLSDFVTELERLGSDTVDFAEAVKNYLSSASELPESVKRIILRSLE